MTKLCARGKSAAKRKFKVYPSAYANAYASKICAGKIKDPSGTKKKDWGPKKANEGAIMEMKKLSKGGGQDMGAKKKKKKKNKYDNNLEDLPRGLKIDTTTDSSGSAADKFMCGGMARGTGAAIRGTKFKGVF
jgi:hypothetical protein